MVTSSEKNRTEKKRTMLNSVHGTCSQLIFVPNSTPNMHAASYLKAPLVINSHPWNLSVYSKAPHARLLRNAGPPNRPQAGTGFFLSATEHWSQNSLDKQLLASRFMKCNIPYDSQKKKQREQRGASSWIKTARVGKVQFKGRGYKPTSQDIMLHQSMARANEFWFFQG